MRHSLGALCILTTLAAILLMPAWLNDRALFPRDARSVVPWRFNADAALRAELAAEPVNDTLTDKNVFDHPKLALARQLWQDEGKVPLWNPHTFCGNPLIATAMPSPLYPPNWLSMVFPYRGFTWVALLHFALSGWFMFLYVRAAGFRPSAGLLAGTTYAFSGWYLVHLYLPSYLYTATWFPLMLLAIERLMGRESTGGDEGKNGPRHATAWFAVLAVAVGLAALAGFPPVLFLSLYAAAFYTVLRIPIAIRAGGIDAGLGRPVICGLAVAAGLGLAAFQLAPTWELAKASGRSNLSRESLREGALRPLGLLGLAAPDFFGNPARVASATRDADAPAGPIAPRRIGLDGAPPPEDWGNNYLENTLYVGIVPLLLALLALVRRRRHVTYIWFVVAVAALAFSLAVPPLDRIASLAPGLQTGSLKRCLFLFTAAAAILAGIGFDGAIVGTKRHRRLIAFMPIVVLTLAAGALVAFPASLESLLTKLIPFGEAGAADVTAGEMAAWVENTRWCILRLGAVLLPIAILFALLKRGVSARPLRFAVLLIVFADLAWLGYRFNPVHRPDQTAETPGIEFLRAAMPGRHAAPTAKSGVSMGRIARFGPDAHFILPPDTGMLYGLDDIQGWDVLFPARYQRFMNLIEPEIAKAHHLVGPFRKPKSLASRLVDMLGVRYLLTGRDWGTAPAPGYRRAYPLRANVAITDTGVAGDEHRERTFDATRIAAEGLTIYENTEAMPRAWIAPRVRTVDDEEAVFAALADESFDPRRTALIEGTNDLPAYSDTDATVRVKAYGARRVTLEVDAGGPATLVLADAFAPGWTARLTGTNGTGTDQPLSIHRANGIFRAVGLPAREAQMEIVFHYAGDAFRKGVYASTVAAVLLLLILVIGLIRSRTPTPSPRPEEN